MEPSVEMEEKNRSSDCTENQHNGGTLVSARWGPKYPGRQFMAVAVAVVVVVVVVRIRASRIPAIRGTPGPDLGRKPRCSMKTVEYMAYEG